MNRELGLSWGSGAYVDIGPLTLLKLPNSFSDSNRHNYEDAEESSHSSQGSEKTPQNKTNKLTVGETVAQLRGYLPGVGEALGSGS